jgi:parvulin-like peptidyl-prolyl isomerase
MAIAREWLRQQSQSKTEVTLDDIRVYYEQHAADFDHTARAKWEELMVRFDEFPTKAAAYQAIAAMGNQVFGGRPLADVAKVQSQGSTASEGGGRDWTTEGSLACEPLDRAIFGLPVGQLSPIIESERGYHIVRVTQREDAHRTPFADAQAEIRERLKADQQKAQGEKFLAKLKRETPVWTIYDGDASSSANAGGYPYR